MLTSNVAHASRLRLCRRSTPTRDLSELALPLAAEPALLAGRGGSGVERVCPLRSRLSAVALRRGGSLACQAVVATKGGHFPHILKPQRPAIAPQ